MKKLWQNDWFRCISVLLVIAVLLSGILAVLNDLLFVSASERTMRAIKKIYGEEKSYDVIIDVDGDESVNTPITYDEYGTVNKVYVIGDKNADTYELLLQTTGIDGYKGGTITVWTQVGVSGDTYSIIKVLYQENTKQTLMSKLTGEFYGKFVLTDVTAEYKAGKEFAPVDGENVILNPVSGATKSANAGNNAVNCVLKYLGENYDEN